MVRWLSQAEDVLRELLHRLPHILLALNQSSGESRDIQSVVELGHLDNAAGSRFLLGQTEQLILPQTDLLVLQSDQIEAGLARLVSPDPVNGLAAGKSGFVGVGGKLHPRDLVYLGQFADQTESRLLLAAGDVGADRINIDLAAIGLHLNQPVLVKVIRSKDGEIEVRHVLVPEGPDLFGQLAKVTRVEPGSELGDACLGKGL